MPIKSLVRNLSYLSNRPPKLHTQITPVQVKRVFSSRISIMSDEWKTRAPYKIHESDKDFHVRYEGGCHCGRVKYQLSREKPLDSKFCHCTTCQKLHGEFFVPYHVGDLANDRQVRLFNGQRYSTRKISTSPTAIMTSFGMTAERRRPSINCLANLPAVTVVHPSWTKGGI